MNNKIKICFLIFLLSFALSVIASTFINSLLYSLSSKESFNFNLMIKQLVSNSNVLKLTLIFFTILSILFFYNAFKLSMFSNAKILNRVDRTESNLHGSANFLSIKELANNFGALKTNELGEMVLNKNTQPIPLNKPFYMKNINNSTFSGFILSSKIENNDLAFYGVSNKNGLVLGSTGSGKTQFLLSPTIQANAKSKIKPSMVINDIKGELYQSHSKLLSDCGYSVILINLRQPRASLRFNPLDIIWELYQEHKKTGNYDLYDKVAALINDIVNTMIPLGKGDNKVWDLGAQGIVKGILWGMLEDSQEDYNMTKEKFTFIQISNILNKQKNELADFLSNRPKTSEVFNYASMIIDNESEKTLASYISNTQTAISIFLDTGIQYITSASDFKLEELTKKPIAIFFVIPDEDKSRYPLANLMLVQLYNFLIFEASKTVNLSLKRPYYFFLDEFGNMPEIPQFDLWISTARSRNIYFMIILQSISQLKNVFGEDKKNTILQNCQFQMYLKANEINSLEYFKKQMGSYTVLSRNVNVNLKQNSSDYQGSTSVTKKDLVTLDELQYIKPGKNYFLIDSLPAKGTLIPLFDKKMQAKKVFNIGEIKLNLKTHIIDFNKTFFDLNYRNNKYIEKQALEYRGGAINKVESKENEKLNINDFNDFKNKLK